MKLVKKSIKKLSLDKKELVKSQTDKIAAGHRRHTGDYTCHALR